jgi:hypothetical protein
VIAGFGDNACARVTRTINQTMLNEARLADKRSLQAIVGARTLNLRDASLSARQNGPSQFCFVTASRETGCTRSTTA